MSQETSNDLETRSQRRAELAAKLGVGDADAFPLSFSQLRQWFLEQMTPGEPAYYVPIALRLRGPLDTAALEDSLGRIVQRHESLRTTFRSIGGQPVQVVSPEAGLSLTRVDLTPTPASERDRVCRLRLKEESLRSFDLEQGPLLRVHLFQLATDDHVLLLSVHHIITDGWSMAVLFRELNSLYAGYLSGTSASLPQLPVQYGDWAVWHRRWVEETVVAEQMAYWKETLSGMRPLQLPTDRVRPALPSSRGATLWWPLPEGLGDRLRVFARQESATLFMVLVSAFAALLQRYTGQDDVSIGTPVSNRSESETQDLIGLFVNMLVLRVDASGDPTFRELVRRVREASLGAYAHQDLPIERLVGEVQPSRDPSRAQMFRVVFALEQDLAAEVSLPNVTAEDLRLDTGTAKFDMTLFVWERPNGLEAAFEYSTELFEAETVSRLARHFATLLNGVVADPERRLSRLPLLSPEEERRVLTEWNLTETEVPRNLTVAELIEEQVARDPGAIAAEFGDESMTYGDLGQRADQLAVHLNRLGVGPESLVAVLLDRSLDIPVAILGVLKAQGAYLPLDPSYPADRLAFMFEDSRASVLLTQERLLGLLPPTQAAIVCLDRDWPAVAGTGRAEAEGASLRTRAARRVFPDDRAYVIYTSGSTGRPKGTELTQQGLLNLVSTHPAYYRVHRRSRMLQFAALSFDASVWEVFLALSQGATLVLACSEELRDPQSLAALLDRKRITVVLLPPSMLAQLPPEAARSLETLCVGGEACPPGLAAAWAGRDCLVNAYGPTEITIIATSWPVPAEFAGERAPAIGWALPNVRAYVLDSHLHPTPIGVPGELYVGGAGVARGYLGRPGLTAERFVPDPHGSEPGRRLYRTGDLVRLRADGAIEYLGRIDHQVKIRGFRVELGEIEAALGAHEQVREAAVAVWEPTTGDPRVVAYVVPRLGAAEGGDLGPGELTVETLRRHLARRLPDYMMPSVFVALHSLPVTPSGKLDRRALPDPAGSAMSSETAYVAPRNGREEVVASVWRRVLGRERIGVHDNFFDLGGHSLLATRVMSAVRQSFRLSLPLRVLFEHPTVAGLTERVEEALLAGLDPDRLTKLLGEMEAESHD